MSKLFVAVCLLCVVQVAVSRSADKPQTDDLQNLAKKAEDALSELHTKFLDFVGVKSNDELVSKVQDQGKEYATKVQDLVNQLSSESGKAGEVFQEIGGKLQAAVSQLQTPELNSDVEKLQGEFQNRLQTILKETESFGSKLTEEGKVVSGHVEEVLKKIYDNTLETAKKVAADIDSATAKKA